MNNNRRYKILIVGKKPYTGRNRMGMGGVGVHVVRLTNWLDREKINYIFYDLSLFKLFEFIKYIKNSSIGHLHSSSPYFRLLFSLVCKLFRTVSVCTYHGELGRFGKLKNYCDYLSVRLMDYPIVLNEHSFNQSIKRNSNTRLISAYIPSFGANNLSSEIMKKLSEFRSKYNIIIVTNAFAMSYDKKGEEIYGIIPLVDFFESYPDVGLVVSDSSGDYSKYFGFKCKENVFIIDEPHPFVGVLDYADIFIRYTTTDGDSLSIHEAIDKGVFVIATNVVTRPAGCILVNRDNKQDLSKAIDIYKSASQKKDQIKYAPNVEIFEFYKKCLFVEENC